VWQLPQPKLLGDLSASELSQHLTDTMELSIIIVNWNSLSLLRTCLASIYKHIRGVSFEVIVVDNASREDDIHSLKDGFPDVLTIKSQVNLGFAGANNLGFKRSSGDYILFLNPDTEIVGDAVQGMLEQSRALPDAGVVGCKLLNTDHSVQTACIQKFPTIPNQLIDFEYLRLRWPNCSLWDISPLFSKSDKPVPVEIVSGACMLLKREVFQHVGMFTEDYFMYAEDWDLCDKVASFGLLNYYVGNSEVIHHGGQSSNQVNVSHWSVIMRFKAVQKFCAKRRGPVYAWFFRVAMGGVALGRLIVLSLSKLLRLDDSRKQAIRYASSKWFAVLKWSCGLDVSRLKPAPNR
jgi:N-acetylglucosaminyl-diphospho-decaprenol L-rhamnosyltransferase